VVKAARGAESRRVRTSPRAVSGPPDPLGSLAEGDLDEPDAPGQRTRPSLRRAFAPRAALTTASAIRPATVRAAPSQHEGTRADAECQGELVGKNWQKPGFRRQKHAKGRTPCPAGSRLRPPPGLRRARTSAEPPARSRRPAAGVPDSGTRRTCRKMRDRWLAGIPTPRPYRESTCPAARATDPRQ